MKTKFLTTLLISFFFISCKNDTKETVNQPQVETNDFFSVTYDVVLKKDDDFQIYYTEKDGEIFSEEKSIWKNIKVK